MLPNMSGVLTRWERPVTIKSVSISTVDFVPVETLTPRTQLCVVQVADKDKLNADTIDWSKEYILVHTSANIELGELVEFEGLDYKIINRSPWRGYGYIEAVGEEVK